MEKELKGTKLEAGRTGEEMGAVTWISNDDLESYLLSSYHTVHLPTKDY